MMSQAEFSSLYSYLKSCGVYLKVNADQKSGVLIGTANSLAGVSAGQLTDDGLHILEGDGGAQFKTGLTEAGDAMIGFGGALAAAGAVPEPASPGLILVGGGIAAFGAGIVATVAIFDLLQGYQNTPAKKPTSSNDSTDDTEPDGEDVSVPDGTVYGEVEGDAQQLADGIVSLDLTGMPDNFNDGQTISIPGFSGSDSGGDGEGGSG